MAIFQTYEQAGKKLSFANWISNISPEETPFVSATGKETIDQTKFSWQVDSLASAAQNAVQEGSDAVSFDLKPTDVIDNQTQILRKVVIVSDTANSTANYGRGRELMYQLEKAGAEIKRDLEYILLNNDVSSYGVYFGQANPGGQPGNFVPGVSSTNPAILPPISVAANARTTGGFKALVGRTANATAGGRPTVNVGTHTGTVPDDDFKQVVVHQTAGTGTFDESDIFKVTEALYIVGSKADTIMLHPKWAGTISSFQEGFTSSGAATRVRYFENVKTLDLEVNTIVTPLGQTFKILYNRYMPENALYFFTPSDWTQMVLRAPTRTELAKTGSSQKWMIEMEVGLRHRNPYASGILNVK